MLERYLARWLWSADSIIALSAHSASLTFKRLEAFLLTRRAKGTDSWQGRRSPFWPTDRTRWTVRQADLTACQTETATSASGSSPSA